MRVVSLVPSVTETLRAWGLEPVACTRFCDAAGIPTVGGTKNPDIEAVVGLEPDLVVVDEEENRREDHAALVAAGVPVHVLAVRDVADVAPQLGALAARVGVPWCPPPLPPPAATRRGAAVVPIWRRPWVVLGTPTYGASVLARLGVEVVSPAGAGAYPRASAAELATLGRQTQAFVVAPSEPYPFGPRHAAELEAIGPVVFVDGRDLFWWGVRTAGALERLAAVLGTARP